MLLQNVIASQLSKNFSAYFAAPFLNGSAKVSVLCIPANFSFDLFLQKRLRQTNNSWIIFEELTAFFEAGCKYRMLTQLKPNNYEKDMHMKSVNSSPILPGTCMKPSRAADPGNYSIFTTPEEKIKSEIADHSCQKKIPCAESHKILC